MKPDDVILQSIEFKGHTNVIAAVKCNLSNGQSSPLFENSCHEHNKNLQIINFDKNRAIRAVGAAENTALNHFHMH